MNNDIEYCPKCGRIVGKHQPSAALGAAREILSAPLDSRGNTVIDFNAIDRRTPPAVDRCYWCGTEVQTAAKIFNLSPESKAKYDATAPQRLMAFARLAAYISRVDGGSPAKSRLYNYVLFKLSNKDNDKAREINRSLAPYDASMPYEQLRRDIAPLFFSPKTLCFAWRLIREDGIFTPNEERVFMQLVKEFGLDDSQVEMIKYLTENNGGMSEVAIYDSFIDLGANVASNVETNVAKEPSQATPRSGVADFERLDNCDSPTYQQLQDGDTSRFVALSEVNVENSEIIGIYTRTGEKLLVFAITSSAKCYDVIPGTKVISNQAFVDSMLSEIYIPDSVTAIGKTAFNGCKNLKAIYTPKDNVQSLRMLINKDLWPLVKPGELHKLDVALCLMANDNIQFAISPDGIVMPIDDDFSLKDCVLPPFVKELASGSFCNLPSLESISLPASLVKVANDVFSGCPNLKRIYVPKGHADRICELLPNRLARFVEEDSSLPTQALEYGYSSQSAPKNAQSQRGVSSNNVGLAASDEAVKLRELGLRYEEGDGVEEDIDKANQLYLKAAQLGDAVAIRYLGVNYEEGNGFEEDIDKANRLYRKAADMGDAGAMRCLGINYEEGNGFEEDYVKAAEWYQKAVDSDDAAATRLLGVLYEYGRGVKKNLFMAYTLYTRAVSLGDGDDALHLWSKLQKNHPNINFTDIEERARDAEYCKLCDTVVFKNRRY